MRWKPIFLFAFLFTLIIPTGGQEPAAYFSLSTNKTFLPGEKVGIRVYANNVEELEFRVYKIKDPAQFFERLESGTRVRFRHARLEAAALNHEIADDPVKNRVVVVFVVDVGQEVFHGDRGFGRPRCDGAGVRDRRGGGSSSRCGPAFRRSRGHRAGAVRGDPKWGLGGVFRGTVYAA